MREVSQVVGCESAVITKNSKWQNQYGRRNCETPSSDELTTIKITPKVIFLFSKILMEI